MPVLVYADQKYRTLAGNKIFDGSKWVTMGGDSKIYLDGKWHDFSWKKAEIPEVPSDPEIPSWDDFTHLATEEPTLGNVYYMTPTGAGQMDGSSWDNAWSASQIHIAMLTITEGSRLYMAEGDYGMLDHPLAITHFLTIYGGFVEGDYSWETRDAFKHPTVIRGNGEFAFASGSDLSLDGLSLNYFAETGFSVEIRNVTAIDCVFTYKDRYSPVDFINCRLMGGSHKGGKLDSCLCIGYEDKYMGLGFTGEMVNSTCKYCYPVDEYTYQPSSNESRRTIYSVCRSCSNSTLIDIEFVPSNERESGVISVRLTGHSTPYAGVLHNTKLVRCNLGLGYLDGCVVYNCKGNCYGESDCSANLISDSEIDVPSSMYNTTFIRSLLISSDYYSMISKCMCISCICRVQMYESIILNSMVSSYTYVSLIVNCKGSISAYYTTIVNSIANVSYGKSTVFWNNDGTISAESNAQSAYNESNALTLGTDNSIARFVNTGYAPAIGVQEIGDCPDPLKDPDGFADYIASFGDWHPQADSFLIGKGIYDSSYNTTDLDGVTRPDPPTIGAYEPRPE